MQRTFGPQFLPDAAVRFVVHAPACEKLTLRLEGDAPQEMPMVDEGDRTFAVSTRAATGTRYWFRVPDGNPRPDPASRFQPDGVHGPSELIDPTAYTWNDQAWRGLPKKQMVVYELHVGTFTKDGTYLAAIKRLDELVELGINTVELMPVAQSAGRWNWGYDGTCFFAPHNTFGTPDELKQLVDAAHQRGIAMIMDVVYNHFGAEGNYLHPFGGYVSPEHHTVWGDAPHLDGEGSAMMRDYIVENTRYWIEDFHFDGLRLDATHCILDKSPRHIVGEIGQKFAEMQSHLKRELHLIAESNIYDPELITSLDSGGYGFDALWCDDFLHSVAAETRPDEHMSDRRYVAGDDIEAVLRRGYVFRGTLKEPRRRVPLAEDASVADWSSLIFSIQNHDFIGNHPDGKRLHQVTSPEIHRAAAALMLMLPAIPMLFMGEEFATESPFYFFTDFGDAHLRDAVERGRRREHPQHDWTKTVSCLSKAAFVKSRIGARENGDRQTLDWYRSLLKIRRKWIDSGLMSGENLTASWNKDAHLATISYRHESDAGFAIVRLASAAETITPIRIETESWFLLSQETKILAEAANQFLLGPSGVVLGEGAVPRIDSAEPL
ncbi:malto-oligosyltrehalose trehalohydrolase [bacterium]|nr:malto-oligosyltrehalose trehalohydrolase [bacterium]